MAILKTLPDLIASFNHSTLLGLGNDDHTQYILVDGTRAFSNPVTGVTPVNPLHLATKQYIDDEISALSFDHGSLTGLTDDDHTQYHNDARALLWIGTRSTSDLPEGTNLYYTATRFDTAFGLKSIGDLSDVDLSGISNNDVLSWDGIKFIVGPPSTSGETNTASNVNTGGGIGLFKQKTLLNLEFKGINIGSNKLSITDNALNDEIELDIVSGNINTAQLNNDAGFITSTGAPVQTVNTQTGNVVLDTDDISEATNLYYTEGRVNANTNVTANTAHRGSTSNPHTTTLTQVLAADGGTTATTANIEELTDGSVTALHSHAAGATDHGALTGLGDDDHSQYHNDTRGDVRYYTKTLLDAGQLDTRYYTETEVDALLNHGTLTGLGDDDHTQYTLADGTRAFSGVVSGVTPTIAAHLATKGYVDGEISGLTQDHGGLLGLGDDDHTQYILADGTRAFSGVVVGVTPTLGTHLTTKDYVDGLINGASWQDPVLDKDLVTSPGSPTTGDRHIIAGIGGAWSGFTINDIVEYNGASWDNETPTEGFAVWVLDEDIQYTFNGTSWVQFGSTVNHSNLTNLGNDDHTQYHNDGRALTWLGTRSTSDLSEGTNLYYTELRVSANTDVAANTTDRHTHSNKAILDAITAAGSGSIITVGERALVASALQNGDNISELVNDSGFITTSDIWERSGTTISPINTGDDLDMEDGDIIGINNLEASTGETLSFEGNSTDASTPAFDFTEITDNLGGSTNALLRLTTSGASEVLKILRNGEFNLLSGAKFGLPVSSSSLSFTPFTITTEGHLWVKQTGGVYCSMEVDIRNDSANNGGNVAFRDHIRMIAGATGVEGDKIETTSTDVDGRGGLIIDQITSLTNNGTYLLRARNAGTEKFAVTHEGGIRVGQSAVNTSATYTTSGECISQHDTNSNAITVSISSEDIANKLRGSIKDVGGNAGTVGRNILINCQGGQTIDGSLTAVINSNYGVVRWYSDGTNVFSE